MCCHGGGYLNSSGPSSSPAYYPSNGSNGKGGYRPRNNGDARQGGRSNLYCDYCHYRGHTNESCYKLHGYPKKKRGSSSHANSAATGGHQLPESGAYDDSSVSTNAKSYGTSPNNLSLNTQGMSLFTNEQYNQIIHMLSKGKGKEADFMANVATARWQMLQLQVHQCTDLGFKSDMKVNFSTGAQVAISHVGDSLVLKDKLVKDVLFIPDFHGRVLGLVRKIKRVGKEFFVILVYVDDLLVTDSNLNLIQQVRKDLQHRFKMKDLGELKYFLGIEFFRNTDGILINQRESMHLDLQGVNLHPLP
uniref:Reverse transcriptase Ty1/copia-type domain-containing protein n=1 Tax=Solanum lycopersicum TaxID=4081 RepID=A0A3Q7GFP8_SOLLC